MDEKLHGLIQLLGERWPEMRELLAPEDWAAFVAGLEALQPTVDRALTPRAVAEAYTDLQGLLQEYPALDDLQSRPAGERFSYPQPQSPSISVTGGEIKKDYNRILDVLDDLKSRPAAPKGGRETPGNPAVPRPKGPQ
jgi:hypothetical protein